MRCMIGLGATLAMLLAVRMATGQVPQKWAIPPDEAVVEQEWLQKFADPNAKVPAMILLASPMAELQGAEWDNSVKLRQLHTAHRNAQDAVLNTLSPNDYKIRRRFKNIPGFSCEINRAALEMLQRNPQVVAIEPILTSQPHGAQGIPLMNGIQARTMFDGTGIAIAIVDTGVDARHPRLGGAPFPNT